MGSSGWLMAKPLSGATCSCFPVEKVNWCVSMIGQRINNRNQTQVKVQNKCIITCRISLGNRTNQIDSTVNDITKIMYACRFLLSWNATNHSRELMWNPMRETVALKCSKPPKPINISLIWLHTFAVITSMGKNVNWKLIIYPKMRLPLCFVVCISTGSHVSLFLNLGASRIRHPPRTSGNGWFYQKPTCFQGRLKFETWLLLSEFPAETQMLNHIFGPF